MSVPLLRAASTLKMRDQAAPCPIHYHARAALRKCVTKRLHVGSTTTRGRHFENTRTGGSMSVPLPRAASTWKMRDRATPCPIHYHACLISIVLFPYVYSPFSSQNTLQNSYQKGADLNIFDVLSQADW